MKLKLVVASMSVLGLISCPVLAASDQAEHKHHHRMKHHHEENYKGEEAVEAVGYKGEVVSTCPRVSVYDPILDAMSQNVGRAKATVDCDKPIQFAGGINFDTQWGNLSEGFMGENNTRFTLNDAYINATGHVNDWVSAFLELSYNNIQDTALNGANFGRYPTVSTEPLPGLYSAGYTLDQIDLQQGYIMLGNPEKFPLFLKLGKQFLDYGRYSIHPITRSMTQVMTETLQTSAELSFISAWSNMDFHGSIFTFQNQITEIDEDDIDTDFGVIDVAESAGNNGKTNFGIQLGVGQVSNQLGWDVGVGYMYNLFGVNDIAYATTAFKGGIDDDGGVVNVDQSFYVDRVSGLTVYGMVNSGPFSLSAHYATALDEFDAIDLGFGDDDDGAQPWAFDITAAYGFNYWNRSQNIYVGYQQSGEAADLFIPQYRWTAGYGIDVLKNTNVGLEYSYDKAYDEDDGQDDESTNRIALRVAVKFG